ncbi:co-chaperone HscB [Psychrobium sp. 1_MG-2023]|uniref:co-chaperone HscB n=1 Tax=Psychrobium sp. 1_MG-2023 TaxID=3062624 RepID=UPI000C31D1CB|nr:co-chaperone HscB [Psychrobium sp. 1_MG-2023]MDP2560566.1 co-chaperone HscB [Psychrobium sp. 1_MG-2023]PKF57553.1 co-chaperone HscB [Alteromonadales bacterium alter-6D02]
MNYFELFALPTTFEVNASELKAKYLELQRTIHPDNFANASERERLMAVHKAAQINDAFDTLKSHDKRAEYLLSLAGIELAHETKTLRDPMFLMQQMELRELLEDIPQASDPEQALSDFQQQVEQAITQFKLNFSRQFAENSADTLQQAADDVRKLKFMLKLSKEAEALEEQIYTY